MQIKNYKEWEKLIKYVPDDKPDFYKKLCYVLFDIDKEGTSFENIKQIVRLYETEFEENEEVEDFKTNAGIISEIDPIFFQTYAKNEHGVYTEDYQKQADLGAIMFCEVFIQELYEQMDKDGLFE